MLEIYYSSKEIKERRLHKTDQDKIGFVPTMGNLHQGHLSIIERSLRENDLTFLSIFVNPKQFAPHEDFNSYPRTLEKDIELCKETLSKFKDSKQQLIIFAPKSNAEIYPENFTSSITVGPLSKILEGHFRPGFFDGVCTVLYLLIKMIAPHKLYLGEKDYQQYIIVKKMISDLSINLPIIPCPTIRDKNGLALSSRNSYLSDNQITPEKALWPSLNLKKAKKLLLNDFKKGLDFINSCHNKKNVDYFKIVDRSNLNDLIELHSNHTEGIILCAYNLESVRLIDNMTIDFQNIEG